MPLRSTSITVVALALTVLLAPPTHAQTAAKTAKPGDVVTLAFDWPVGTTARVSVEKSQLRSRDGETTDSTASAVSYAMYVTEHPNGLLVSFDDIAVGRIEGIDGVESGMEGLFNSTIGSLMPDLVVGLDGTLLALDDVDGLIDSYRTLLTAAVDSLVADPEAQARSDEFLAGFLSPETLTALTADEWNVATGAWVGAELEVGVVYNFPTEGSVPIVPGATVPMTMTFSLVDRVPCGGGADGEAGCVALKLATRYDEDALEEVIAAFLGGLAPEDAASPRFEAFQSKTGARIVVDPATLLPYRVETYKDIEVTVSAPPEEAGAFTRRDRKVTTYAYDG